ncbi:MAG: hypothetical protein H0T63_08410, partial [Pyrinomonadaceae bacterium]|nr:hypothetical protein [Pyrinomonadaceae bacterium]
TTFNSNAVKLWETATGRELRTLASSANAGAGYLNILTGVSAVAFSADSRLLATGGRDNSLTLWDVTNGRELRTFDAQAAAAANNLAALAGTGVTALAFTPDGQRLISMGDALRVWDVATGRALQTLAADISLPTALSGTQLAISPDGSQVAMFRTALSNNEKTIAIIDLNTGREARSFKLPDDLYGNSAILAFTSGGQVFAADVDQSRLKFWNVTAKEKPRTLAEFDESFGYQTAFSPDGRLLALAAGGALKIWDTSSGRELNAIAVIPPAPANTGTIQDAITSFAFSRDGRQLAVSARRQLTTQLALWDTNSSQLIREMSTGKTNYAYQVAFSADGTRLVSGGKTIWDLTTGRGLRAFVPTATDPFGSLSRDGRLLATSNFNDNRITLYDVATQRKLSTLAPAEQANTSEIVVFSPDRKLLASAYRLSQEQLQQRQHPTLKRESPNSGDLSKMQKEAMKEAMKAAQKDPLAAMRIMQEKMMQQSAPQSAPQAGIESQVKLWNTATGQPAGSLSLPSGNPFIPGYVGHVLFSPDSRTLAVTSQTGPGVTLWDVATGRQLASIGQPPTAAANANPFGMIANPLSGGGVTALAFSPDGRLLATGGKDLKSNFDLSSMMSAAMASASGRGGRSKGQTPAPPNVADLMQNLKPTVSVSLKIYDAASGQELRAFPGLANEIKAVAFSRDALTLAAAASDNAIKLYDLTSGRERLTLRGHTAGINSVAFNPNGQILASASHDGSTLLWDARTGEQLATLISLGKDGSDWLVVTPDGLFDG